MEKSQNQITREHSLSPDTVNKRMTRKVTGLSSELEGTQRGKILSAGEFQAIWLIREWVPCNFYHVSMHVASKLCFSGWAITGHNN